MVPEMKELRADVGVIQGKCECGECPTWINESVGKLILRVTEGEIHHLFGPFENPEEIRDAIPGIIAKLSKAATPTRDPNPHWH